MNIGSIGENLKIVLGKKDELLNMGLFLNPFLLITL